MYQQKNFCLVLMVRFCWTISKYSPKRSHFWLLAIPTCTDYQGSQLQGPLPGTVDSAWGRAAERALPMSLPKTDALSENALPHDCAASALITDLVETKKIASLGWWIHCGNLCNWPEKSDNRNYFSIAVVFSKSHGWCLPWSLNKSWRRQFQKPFSFRFQFNIWLFDICCK